MISIKKLNGKIYMYPTDKKLFCFDVYVIGMGTDKEVFLIDYSLCNMLYNMERLCDKSALQNLKNGAPLYVVPPCEYALDAIRKNYSIKKKIDTGDFNVFSNIKPDSFLAYASNVIPNTSYGCGVYVSEDCGLVILDNRRTNYGNSACKISDSEMDEVKDYMLQKFGVSVSDLHYDRWQYLKTIHDSENPIRKLLEGTLTKPALYVDWLSYDTENKLDIDVLNLVFTAGKANYSEDNYNNFITELGALNQYDWREYPYTLSIIGRILYAMKFSTYREVSTHTSRLPKAVKGLVAAMENNAPSGIESQKDWNMGKQLVDLLMGKSPSFTTPSLLEYKLSEKGVPRTIYDKYYFSLVKLTPREYKTIEA